MKTQMKNKMKIWKSTVVVSLAMLVSIAVAQQKTTPNFDAQLKAASQKELVDGDAKGAIAMYQKIVATPGSVGRISDPSRKFQPDAA